MDQRLGQLRRKHLMICTGVSVCEHTELHELSEECYECNKKISDDEWVVNWGSCSECFDRLTKNT